jgi:hypothetical protein
MPTAMARSRRWIFNQFRLAYGQSGLSFFDFDGDHQVTALDFNEFRLRYGVTLAP